MALHTGYYLKSFFQEGNSILIVRAKFATFNSKIENRKSKIMMNIFDQVNEDIRAAMLARDKERLEAVRNIKKVLLEAKTAKSGAEALPDEEAIKAIAKFFLNGTATTEIYTGQKRQDLADFELAQVKIYEAYLPKQLGDTELTAAIQSIISSCGATSMKEMGKVMGIATKELAGKVDGKLISEKVKSLLG